MERTRVKKVRVVILRQFVRVIDKRPVINVRPEEDGILELTCTVEALVRGRSWRKELMDLLAKRKIKLGEIEAVNILAKPYMGCDVSVVLRPNERTFGAPNPARKRPVTRGGRLISDQALPRTRAALRRDK